MALDLGRTSGPIDVTAIDFVSQIIIMTVCQV